MHHHNQTGMETAGLEQPVHIDASAWVADGSHIGRGTTVAQGVVLHPGAATGRYCTIGIRAEIGVPAPVPGRLRSGALPGPDRDTPRPTAIGHDVWIGPGAVIMAGITIGDGAIVQPGATVTADVAPYDIVDGTPAARTGRRLPESQAIELRALAWWDLPGSDLVDLPLDDIDAALAWLRQRRQAPAPAPQTPQKSAGKRADIAALQALMDAVPPVPKKAPSAAQHAFADLLEEKLRDANAPQVLIDLIAEFAGKLHTRYAVEDPADIAILNTKLIHIIDLVNERSDAEGPISPSLERTVLEIMRSKA